MNTKNKLLDGAPNPSITYQGAYLSLFGADVAIGPFTIGLEPPEKVGIGYAVAQQEIDQVPVTTVRTASIRTLLEDKPDNIVQVGFNQNDTEWLMTFSVLSDPKGGLVGTDFALDVQSNFPQIPMSVARTPVAQAGFNVLTKGILPAGYRAQLTLRYWDNGKTNLPIDSWLAVQVGYVQAPRSEHRSMNTVGVPLVTVGEVLFFPTPGSGDNPVLRDNYPRADRFSQLRVCPA